MELPEMMEGISCVGVVGGSAYGLTGLAYRVGSTPGAVDVRAPDRVKE